MKLSIKERQVLKEASEILTKIYYKFGRKDFCETESGVFEKFDIDEASTLCELLSRHVSIKFVDDFDWDSNK